MRTKLPLVSIIAAIAVAMTLVPATRAAAESTWDQIKRTGSSATGRSTIRPIGIATRRPASGRVS